MGEIGYRRVYAADGGSIAYTYNEPARRTWTLPDPPGPAVLALRDSRAREWDRDTADGTLWRARQPDPLLHCTVRLSWPSLLASGPLEDITKVDHG